MHLRKSIWRTLIVLLMMGLALSGPVRANVAATNSVNHDWGQEPALVASSVTFIENVGQFAEGVRFQVRGGGGTMWLAEDAIWVTVVERVPSGQRYPPGLNQEGGILPSARLEEEGSGDHQGVNLKLSFAGANPNAVVEPFDPLNTAVSYFIGSDPDGWRTDVPVFGGVRYVALYPGVDLELTSKAGRWAWRMVCSGLACESSLQDVRLEVEGAEALSLTEDALRLDTAVGGYLLPLLHAVDGHGDAIVLPEGEARLTGSRVELPFFDSAATEGVGLSGAGSLVYSTLLGGSADDLGYGIATDTEDRVYITGETWSGDYPTTPGAFNPTHNGNWDVFVTMLDPKDTALVYSTFLGGIDGDHGLDIAVDTSGRAHVTGYSSSADFPTTPGAYQEIHSGMQVVFVSVLNPEGNDLIYSTFLGGSDPDYAYAIAVGDAGHAYVTGQTHSRDFPTTPGAYDTTYFNNGDVFVSVLTPDGTDLVYSTYLSGRVGDVARGIAVDNTGRAFITGETRSFDFPTTAGAYDRSYNGGNGDVFVSLLNADGSDLVYSTFVGGESHDGASGIAIDAVGRAYITGYSWKAEFRDYPTTPGAFDTSHNGLRDAFVTVLNAEGSNLVYSTFLGSSSRDYGESIAIDEGGRAYVTGYTDLWYHDDFPTTPGGYDTTHNGGWDAFVSVFNSDGTELVYSSFLGGGADDRGMGIATGESGWAYVVGMTDSEDFPVTPNAYDTEHNGGWDAFVTVFDVDPEYVLSVSVVGEGEVDVQPAQETYYYGDAVTLTATADAGWTFVAWSGDIESTDNPLELSIQGNTELTATFAQDQYTLDVAILGSGDVDIDPEQATYHYGDEVTLTATADPGWTFDHWGGPDAGDLSDNSDGTWTLVMDDDKSVTATFTQDEYSLDITVVGEGDVEVDPDQDTYHYGDVVALTATANPGWTFTGWGGHLVSTENPLEMTIEGDTSVTATFESCLEADFQASLTAGVPPLTVAFTNASTGDYADSLWDFGDGVTSTEEHPSHTYQEAGVYTVALTVNSPAGDTASVSKPDYINTVSIFIEPATTTAHIGQTFDLTLIVQSGDQAIDGAQAYLDFDPAVLEVVDLAGGSALPTELQNQYDNDAGTIGYSAGLLTGEPPSGTFPLATVTFRALAETEGITIPFVFAAPRTTLLTSDGRSILGGHRDARVTVGTGATLNGSVDLQGRPDPPDPAWSIPLTLTLHAPGSGELLYTFGPSTDESGAFSISDITPGSYDATVKGVHTLANRKAITLTPGPNTISFGTLLEGDANGDNCVNILDFSLLRTAFGTCSGDEGFDGRVDFNEDGCINILDFSLLRTNFGLCGDIEVATAEHALITVGTGSVTMSLAASSTTVAVGEVFTLYIRIGADDQPVDGAQAHLDFDPEYLRVINADGTDADTITPVTVPFDSVLQNKVDNAAGTIDYAAGTLTGDPPKGTFTVAHIRFRAITETQGTNVTFVFSNPRNTDASFEGASVLGESVDGHVIVTPDRKVYLPLVLSGRSRSSGVQERVDGWLQGRLVTHTLHTMTDRRLLTIPR